MRMLQSFHIHERLHNDIEIGSFNFFQSDLGRNHFDIHLKQRSSAENQAFPFNQERIDIDARQQRIRHRDTHRVDLGTVVASISSIPSAVTVMSTP